MIFLDPESSDQNCNDGERLDGVSRIASVLVAAANHERIGGGIHEAGTVVDAGRNGGTFSSDLFHVAVTSFHFEARAVDVAVIRTFFEELRRFEGRSRFDVVEDTDVGA